MEINPKHIGRNWFWPVVYSTYSLWMDSCPSGHQPFFLSAMQYCASCPLIKQRLPSGLSIEQLRAPQSTFKQLNQYLSSTASPTRQKAQMILVALNDVRTNAVQSTVLHASGTSISTFASLYIKNGTSTSRIYQLCQCCQPGP